MAAVSQTILQSAESPVPTVVPALGHNFVVKHPSGIGPSICSRCGYDRGEEYPLPGPIPIIPRPPVVAFIAAEDGISPLSDTPDSGSTEWVLQSTVVESHSYIYAGDRLIQETITTVTTTDEGSETTTDTLYFTYGAVGPTTVTWNGTTYYYALNAQGDVVGIFDGSGNCVVTYNWDNAWGYNPAPEGSMADTLGTLNPLRYRSYVYDEETEFYYVSSRYYDPKICRFINADAFVATGQGLLGNNMFVYCLNNPANFVDRSGANAEALQWWSGTMWWLCGVDTVLPVGDVVYGLGIIVFAVDAWIARTSVSMSASTVDVLNSPISNYSEHKKGARQSTKNKHEKGQTRKGKDNRGEKGDERRVYMGNKRRHHAFFLLFDNDLPERNETAVYSTSYGGSSSGLMGVSYRFASVCFFQ